MGGYFVDTPKEYGQTTFLARRVRPILEGQLGDRTAFRIVPEFGSSSFNLLDAYIDFKVFDWLSLRGGKFKEPVGLERLQTINHAFFPEFAFPTSLLPNRDVGLQAFGEIGGGIVNYAVGVFNGTLDGGSNDVDVNDGKDIAGRVFLQPFLKTDLPALQGLGFGVAGTYGQQEGSVSVPNLASFKTPAQQNFFRYNNDAAANNVTIAAGKNWRFTPQLYYSWGPVGLLSEYVLSQQKVSKNNVLAKLNHQAFQATASVVLTGEKASYKGIKPKKPFQPKLGQWGAVELAGRYHLLDVDDDTFPIFATDTKSATKATSFGGGVNWYLNQNLKLATSYDHTFFKGGAATGNRPQEKLVTLRLQVGF